MLMLRPGPPPDCAAVSLHFSVQSFQSSFLFLSASLIWCKITVIMISPVNRHNSQTFHFLNTHLHNPWLRPVDTTHKIVYKYMFCGSIFFFSGTRVQNSYFNSYKALLLCDHSELRHSTVNLRQ